MLSANQLARNVLEHVRHKARVRQLLRGRPRLPRLEGHWPATGHSRLDADHLLRTASRKARPSVAQLQLSASRCCWKREREQHTGAAAAGTRVRTC